MNLAVARNAIESAPLTHLGSAAKFLLHEYDKCDVARMEAAEAQLAVQAAEIVRLNKALADVERLQRLEHAVKEVVGGIPPSGPYAQRVFYDIKRHLTPHLT